MMTQICLTCRHLVLLILSLVLVWLTTATSTSPGHPLIVVEGVGQGSAFKCIDKERNALLDFKSRLQDHDGRLSTWRVEEESDGCCKWSGVLCNNQTGHVIKLILRDGGLEGEVSPSLLNLTYLTYLDLSYNSFHGTINKFIGSMTKLRYLNFGWNYFNGTIPNSIGSLTNLRYLDLSGNFLHGTIPPEFGNLTNLEQLSLMYLTGCTFENLDWLSRLYNLEYLDMGENSLAKARNWVNVILRLKKLSVLSLFGCDLSEVMHPYSFPFFNSSSSIVYLYLNSNNLNSSMYNWLFPLTSNKLNTLDLSDNLLDGIPKYVQNLCSLTFLSLSGNSINGNFPDFVNNLSGCTSASLQYLDVSYNQLKGSLPDDIQNFSSPQYLFLSYNQLNGTISEKLWELPKLEYLDASFNSFRGVVSENIGRSKLLYIDFSNNSLEGVPSQAHVSNFSYLEHIDLRSCMIGPRFPKWIQKLKNLTHIDVAHTGISDTIPVEFWNTWPSRLTYLSLSSNNISGEVPYLLSNFDLNHVSKIDLSSNNFYGPITNVPASLLTLDVSGNKFFGGISFQCQIVDGFLTYLDLSNNSFTGQIPDCLWHFKELRVLNLRHNSLFGFLPASLGYLYQLDVLHLYNNSFSGELPLSLRNCTELTFMDLGANKFFGNIPVWIAGNLSRLYVLSLTSNNFFGTIPFQLCNLKNLRILDLSMNSLYGTIPSCVNKLSNMVEEGLLLQPNVHLNNGTHEYVDHAMVHWQGYINEFSTNLGLLKSIDLSSNNLTGPIPYELMDLRGLLASNLSKNTLHGEIPRKIGQLKELLTSDLSRNNFSGEIPSSISQINFLNYLDVSHNNLSGRIPSSTQLQSFDPSRYTGNTELCGPPMTKYCPGDEEFQVPPTVGESEGHGEDKDELDKWFYVGGASGFATGFWIVCSTLLLYRRGWLAFFHILDSMKDFTYVKVVVFVSKLQRVVRP